MRPGVLCRIPELWQKKCLLSDSQKEDYSVKLSQKLPKPPPNAIRLLRHSSAGLRVLRKMCASVCGCVFSEDTIFGSVIWLWVKPCTPGEHQPRWYMSVPPQNGGIGYDPWPYRLGNPKGDKSAPSKATWFGLVTVELDEVTEVLLLTEELVVSQVPWRKTNTELSFLFQNPPKWWVSSSPFKTKQIRAPSKQDILMPMWVCLRGPSKLVVICLLPWKPGRKREPSTKDTPIWAYGLSVLLRVSSLDSV